MCKLLLLILPLSWVWLPFSLLLIFFPIAVVIAICLKHFLHFSVPFMRIPLHLVMCGNVWFPHRCSYFWMSCFVISTSLNKEREKRENYKNDVLGYSLSQSGKDWQPGREDCSGLWTWDFKIRRKKLSEHNYSVFMACPPLSYR